MSVPPPLALLDGDVALRPRADTDPTSHDFAAVDASGHRVVSFVVEHHSLDAGTVEIRQIGDGTAELSWSVLPDHRGQGVATRAVRLLIGYAFRELGLRRITAYVQRGDRASLRVAGRAGLRREGIVRSTHGPGAEAQGDLPGQRKSESQDRVQLARLATDPEPTSRDGFIGVLNAGLPTKRVIAQGMIRNNANGILMCELTYKQEWDLPGGVVDPHESPGQALVREIREEMRVEVSPRSLVAVNWLPPWRGWDDATLFVFDLGVDDDIIDRARLEPRELRALHWCDLDQVEGRAAPYVTRMLRRLAQRTEGTAYLEDGYDPNW